MGLGTVTINGQPVDPCHVVNLARITHGRADATAGPTASTGYVQLLVPASFGMPTWAVGDDLTITVDGVPRFTGVLSDVELSEHATYAGQSHAVFDLQGMGAVSTLGFRDVGDTPWPQDTVTGRAYRILTTANVPYEVQGDPTMTVIPRDVDRKPALTLLTELAQDSGAAVFDTPTGQVVFQHYAARAQTWQFMRWMDVPPDVVWADATTHWADWNATATVSPSAPLPISLDMCAVGWEPVWRSTSGQVVNHVTLGYGPPPAGGGEQPTVTTANTPSVVRFGRRHYGADTSLADYDSASERAGMILDLHSDPRWGIAQIVLHLDLVTAAERTTLLGLLCGARVHLTDMPQPAPEHSPVRIVEGWTHTIDDVTDTLVVSVSDPRHSYAGITWGALPPADTVPPLRWMDVPPAVVWADALTLPILQGAP